MRRTFLFQTIASYLLYALAEADAVSGLSSAKTGNYPVNPARLGIA
jgi:hypothetical protein